MPLATGAVLGPYRILSPLGSGGMGEVYRAADTRLGREVAVKVLPDRFAGEPEAAARFEREARAVAALSHPNIIAIFDVGSHEGCAYSVTELLLGETLRERLSGGPLPPRQAVGVAVEIAQGLAAAHDSGVVHRDLKPENVFLTRDGRVKILDFGLAKRNEEAPSSSRAPTVAADRDTMPGAVLGTAGYMAPEQVRGEVVDARADIFALGVLLLEMLTGAPPFGRGSLGETFASILRDDPLEAPAARALAPSISRLLAHCLAKRRAERFQSARDLAFSLQALDREDSSPPPAPRAAPASSSSGRRTGAGPAGPSVAVLPFRNLSPTHENDYLSDGITEEVIGALSRLPGLRIPSRTSCFAFKGKDEDVRRIGERLGVGTVLEGSVRQAGSRLRVAAQLVDVTSGFQLWSDRWDRELSDVFAIQDELARAIADRLKVKLLGEDAPLAIRGTADVEAFNHVLKGRYHFNRREARAAIGEFELALARDPEYVEAYTGLAEAYGIRGFYGGIPTWEAYARAREAAEKARSLAPDSPQVLVALGIIEHYFGWSLRRQEEVLREAIRLSPGSAPAHSWLGLRLAFGGRTAEGLELARTATRLEPHAPNAWTNVAWCHAAARQYAESERALEHALHLDPSAFYALWTSGLVIRWTGRSAEAVERLERSAEISRRVSWVLGALGGAYGAAGRRDDARAVLRELDERGRGEYVAPLHRAFVHIGLGDVDAALDDLERARRERNALVFWVANAPEYDLLRGDPRFPELLARIQADAEAAR